MCYHNNYNIDFSFSVHLKEQMIKFIDGSLDEVPSNNNPLPAEMADIYYLIADHHFKNKTWVKLHNAPLYRFDNKKLNNSFIFPMQDKKYNNFQITSNLV